MTTPIGKYKLIKLIASGGMAEVYLAKQAGAAGFEKLVCLKRILPHLARDKQFVDMFLNEARLAAALDHPNIVNIFDLGEANGNYYIAMEFIDGPNLRSIAKRASELGELLPIAEVVKIISQAAGGLHYAHELTDSATGQPLGLVHRDISPDNILVHKNGSAKVVDFGIAKAANSSGATRTGTLKGKVAYMPPEQLRGEALDRRVDVFALGVCLYELLAGKRPWDGNSEVALIGKIMTEDPQPLAELRPDATPELLAIVESALNKDRDQRYQSCADLQHDLESVLTQLGQTVTASRIAEFIHTYSAVEQPGAATTGVDAAALSQVEESLYGATGAAPALIGPDAQIPGGEHQARTDSGGTALMDHQPRPQPQKGGAWKYGVGAFAAIALIGGGVWFFVLRPPAEEPVVPVESTRIAVEKPPEPVKPPPEPVKQPDPPKQEVKAEPPPSKEEPKPAKKQRRVAQVEKKEEPPPEPKPAPTAPPAVVIIKKEEPKPPPAPPPVIVAKGTVNFVVRPWAKVVVDDKDVGVTPLDGPLTLTAGPHKVRLINPDLGKDVTRTITIPANGHETVKEIFE
jgi:serine/threonine-protein kinase